MTINGWKNDVLDFGERDGSFSQSELGDGFLGIVLRLFFTGILDKSGAEIYEGDIIDGMIVTYCCDQSSGLGMNCGFYLQSDDFERWIELQSRLDGDNYLVQGNIYLSSNSKPLAVRRLGALEWGDSWLTNLYYYFF